MPMSPHDVVADVLYREATLVEPEATEASLSESQLVRIRVETMLGLPASRTDPEALEARKFAELELAARRSCGLVEVFAKAAAGEDLRLDSMEPCAGRRVLPK